MSELARRLRTSMGGRTVKDVARAAKVSQMQIYRMLRDGSDNEDFQLSTIRKLACACRVSPAFLAFGEDR